MNEDRVVSVYKLWIDNLITDEGMLNILKELKKKEMAIPEKINGSFNKKGKITEKQYNYICLLQNQNRIPKTINPNDLTFEEAKILIKNVVEPQSSSDTGLNPVHAITSEVVQKQTKASNIPPESTEDKENPSTRDEGEKEVPEFDEDGSYL